MDQCRFTKATGGFVSFYGGKTIHTFVSAGNLVVPATISDVDYIVLAGGGGGRRFDGSYAGGGGGAGGYILKEGQSLPAATYPVVVGAGGALDSNGNPSVFNSQTAVYGGRGGKNIPGSLVELVVLVVDKLAVLVLLVLVKTTLDQLNKVILVEMDLLVVDTVAVAVVPVVLAVLHLRHQIKEVELEV